MQRMSISINLTPEQVVASNVKENFECYQFRFYPMEGELPPKMSLYIFWKDKLTHEIKARRSLGFTSVPQLRQFLRDSIKAYFNLMENVIPYDPRLSAAQNKLMRLHDLLEEISLFMREEWRR